MPDLFDMLDDAAEPPPAAPRRDSAVKAVPAAATPRQAVAPAAVASRRIPTMRDHLCEADGCHRWGCLGLGPIDLGGSLAGTQWFCTEHAPNDLRFGGRAN